MNLSRWRTDQGRFAASPDEQSSQLATARQPTTYQVPAYDELQRIGEVTAAIEAAMNNLGDGGQLQIQLDAIRMEDPGQGLDIERTRLIAMVQANPTYV